MSVTMNGRAMWDGHSDSTAARCGALIERGMKKFGISTQRLPRVDPTKLKDVFWAPKGLPKGRPRKRLDQYPDVRGLSVKQVAKKLRVTTLVAGRIVALQSRQAPTLGRAA